MIVVSNRLPVTVIEKEGDLKVLESSGGLVSGLSAYLDSLKGSPFTKSDYIWVGWPGASVSNDMKEAVSKALVKYNALPVFITEKEMEKFYHGFCNKTIWPLFHYFPSYVIYDEDYWFHYRRVNEIFCDAILKLIKLGDIVWIHDYHLMLLPQLIRKKMAQVKIAFFLHIPFPSFETFRLLPTKCRSEILNGLLGADLIGFHTYDYTQYFLRCVYRILGYESNMGTIKMKNRIVKVDTFPMGIDFQKFHNAVNETHIKKERSRLKKQLGDHKILLSVDRLDYTKGIINRLKGYELFLNNHPEWHDKIVLLLIVVPSRIGVDHYQKIKMQIDELVGKINGKYGNISWTPILYQYKFLPFQKLVAIYSISDIALITPLRDGMNLIAKEYISTRKDNTGILILSEMAGASHELGEAITINPNSIEEIASALKEALEMPVGEQARRINIMQTRLRRYDVMSWANEIIQNLNSINEKQKRFEARLLGSHRENLFKDFKKANRRLIFLDYDGTLVPFEESPQMAKPTENVLKILRNFSSDKKNEVVLISGRDRNTLLDWFDIPDLGLVAEHGTWIKEKDKDWILSKPLRNDWKQQILPILEMYSDRLPGSFVEEKEFSLVWHYRKANQELASLHAKELVDYLVNFTANIDVQVLQGNKVIEIRNAGVNKGVAALNWISKNYFDFILAIGDDWTDEDLFRILPENAYSIRVGMTSSYARFNLYSYIEILELLDQIIKL